jgi:ribulose-5-phosphate 4-epimerase/fuculose-1-phosphate aldolase
MTEHLLREQWQALRQRLSAKGLMDAEQAGLSLRLPGGAAMWFASAPEEAPRQLPLDGSSRATEGAGLHAAIYRLRPDVGAIVSGGGRFGQCLADFGGVLPQVFDEQARHLGRMGVPVVSLVALERSVGTGGNAVLVRGQPVCLGMTGTRMALNAELFEKCAKAYVLAAAAAGGARQLPWLVRFIANGRLRKDQRRATRSFSLGLLPEESKGY